MKTIICDSNTKYKKFYLRDILSGVLEPCSERDFDAIVTAHRSLYELVYDGANAQNYLCDGVVEARRER